MSSMFSPAEEAIQELSRHLRSIRLEHYVKDRSDGPYLIVEVSLPSERLFKALRAAQASLPPENPFKERATLSKRRRSCGNRLAMPEAQLFKLTLSDSLTVDRYTFGDDFFGRYIRSVFGHEDQIDASANHLVYGRRGSGKSSLLAYAMHSCIANDSPYAWVDMQTYAGAWRRSSYDRRIARCSSAMWDSVVGFQSSRVSANCAGRTRRDSGRRTGREAVKEASSSDQAGALKCS